MDWKELRDGSLRVEQHFITQKESQRKILVGKRGSKIGYSILVFILMFVIVLYVDTFFLHVFQVD